MSKRRFRAPKVRENEVLLDSDNELDQHSQDSSEEYVPSDSGEISTEIEDEVEEEVEQFAHDPQPLTSRGTGGSFHGCRRRGEPRIRTTTSFLVLIKMINVGIFLSLS